MTSRFGFDDSGVGFDQAPFASIYPHIALVGTASSGNPTLTGNLYVQILLLGQLDAGSPTLAGDLTAVSAPVDLVGELDSGTPSLAATLTSNVYLVGQLDSGSPTLAGDVTATSAAVDLVGTLDSGTPDLAGVLTSNVYLIGQLDSGSPTLTGDATATSAPVNLVGELNAGTPILTSILTTPVRLVGEVSSGTPTLAGDLGHDPAQHSLAGTLASGSPTLAAILTTPVRLVGDLASGTPSIVGDLDHDPAQHSLAGTLASGNPTLAGILTTDINLAGGLASENPVLTGNVTVTSASVSFIGTLDSGSPTLTAFLTTNIALTGGLDSGSPTLTGDATATSAPVNLVGQIDAGTPTLATFLTTNIALVGELASGSPTLDVLLTHTPAQHPMAGVLASANPNLTATLTSNVYLSGTLSSGVPVLTGNATAMSMDIELSGSLASGSPTLTAPLTAPVPLTGMASSGGPTLDGDLTATSAPVVLVGTLDAGTAALTGTLTSNVYLVGVLSSAPISLIGALDHTARPAILIGELNAGTPVIAGDLAVGPVLTLADFDDEGLDTDFVGLIQAGETPTLFSQPPRATTVGQIVDGNVLLGGLSNVPITRIQLTDSGTNLRINDDGPLVLSLFFGEDGDGRDLTIYVQTTPDNVQSFTVENTVGALGTGFANFALPADAQAVFNSIVAGNLFILAMAVPSDVVLEGALDSGTPTLTGNLAVTQPTGIALVGTLSSNAATLLGDLEHTEVPLEGGLTSGTPTLAGALTVMQPEGVGLAGMLTSAAPTLAGDVTVGDVLTLADWDDTGLDYDVAALIQAGTPTNLFAQPPRGTSGQVVDGSVLLNGLSNVPITGLSITDSGTNLRLNDDGPLVLSLYFGAGGDGRELSLYIQTTPDNVQSWPVEGNTGALGTSFANFTIPPDAQAVFNTITAGSLFIFALASPSPAVLEGELSSTPGLSGNLTVTQPATVSMEGEASSGAPRLSGDLMQMSPDIDLAGSLNAGNPTFPRAILANIPPGAIALSGRLSSGVPAGHSLVTRFGFDDAGAGFDQAPFSPVRLRGGLSGTLYVQTLLLGELDSGTPELSVTLTTNIALSGSLSSGTVALAGDLQHIPPAIIFLLGELNAGTPALDAAFTIIDAPLSGTLSSGMPRVVEAILFNIPPFGIQLTGILDGRADLTGDLYVQTLLLGTLTSVPDLRASLTAPIGILAGSLSSGAANLNGTLRTEGPEPIVLEGELSSTPDLRATITVRYALNGALTAGNPDVQANLFLSDQLVGDITATPDLRGNLFVQTLLQGHLSSGAFFFDDAILEATSPSVDLGGVLNSGVPEFFGTLTAPVPLEGTLNSGTPDLRATLTAPVPLVGSLDATATLQGLLRVLDPMALNLVGSLDAGTPALTGAVIVIDVPLAGSLDATITIAGDLTVANPAGLVLVGTLSSGNPEFMAYLNTNVMLDGHLSSGGPDLRGRLIAGIFDFVGALTGGTPIITVGNLIVQEPSDVPLAGSLTSGSPDVRGDLYVIDPSPVHLVGYLTSGDPRFIEAILFNIPPTPDMLDGILDAGTPSLTGTLYVQTLLLGELNAGIPDLRGILFHNPFGIIALDGILSSGDADVRGSLGVIGPMPIALTGSLNAGNPRFNDPILHWTEPGYIVQIIEIGDGVRLNSGVLEFFNSQSRTDSNWRIRPILAPDSVFTILSSLGMMANGGLLLSMTANGIPDDTPQNLSDHFRTMGTITVDSGGESVVLTGVGDMADLYQWLPTNSADIQAFRTAVLALLANDIPKSALTFYVSVPISVLEGELSATPDLRGELNILQVPTVSLVGELNAGNPDLMGILGWSGIVVGTGTPNDPYILSDPLNVSNLPIYPHVFPTGPMLRPGEGNPAWDEWSFVATYFQYTVPTTHPGDWDMSITTIPSTVNFNIAPADGVGGGTGVTGNETYTETLTAGQVYTFAVWRHSDTPQRATVSTRGTNFLGLTLVPPTVPATPATPSLSVVNDVSIDVTWVTPTDDGGSPITSYTVQYRESGQTAYTMRLVTSGLTYTITGLTAATDYEVNVMAINAIGSSAASPNATATTDAALTRAVPDQPAAPTVNVISTSILEVTWVEPDDNNSPITGYTVQYRVDGTTMWTMVTLANVLTTTIEGLTPNTLYEVEVQATNDIGSGAFSPTTTATTLAAVAISDMEARDIEETTTTVRVTLDNTGSTNQAVYLRYRRLTHPWSDNIIISSTGTEVDFDLTDLAIDAPYRAEASMWPDHSSNTSSVEWRTLPRQAPDQVFGVNISSITATTVRVNWTAADRAEAYVVQWRNRESVYTVEQKVLTNNTSVVLEGLTELTHYVVRVYAIRTGANDGQYSAEVPFRTLPEGVAQLIEQWRTAPRMSALVHQLLTKMDDNFVVPLHDLGNVRNIDKAEGVWLDYIGDWLGQARPTIPIATDETFFSFEVTPTAMDRVGFDQGSFAREQSLYVSREPVNDAWYRIVLHLRARYLFSDGTVPSLTSVVNAVFPGAHYVSNHDMTMTINIPTIDAALLTMLIDQEIFHAPAGVSWTATITNEIVLESILGGTPDLRARLLVV